MIALGFTSPYATYKGQGCYILGWRDAGRGVKVLVALVDGGDLVLANLEDVKLDTTRLIHLRDHE